MAKNETKHDENMILEGMKRFFALFARRDDLEAATESVENAKKEAKKRLRRKMKMKQPPRMNRLRC